MEMHVLKWWVYMTFYVALCVRNVSCIQEYLMQNNCGKRVSMLFDFVYQFRVSLDDPGVGDCELKIDGWTGERLMFYFDRLDMLCSDGYLTFYKGLDGTETINGLKHDFCGSTKPDRVFTTGNSMRIRYTPKNNKIKGNIFRIIVTTYEPGTCSSYDFPCENGRCITKSLHCNGFDSCGDGFAKCNDDVQNTLSVVKIVLGCIGGVVIVAAIVVILVCCARKGLLKKSPPGTQMQVGYNASNPDLQPRVYMNTTQMHGANHNLAYTGQQRDIQTQPGTGYSNHGNSYGEQSYGSPVRPHEPKDLSDRVRPHGPYTTSTQTQPHTGFNNVSSDEDESYGFEANRRQPHPPTQTQPNTGYSNVHADQHQSYGYDPGDRVRPHGPYPANAISSDRSAMV